MKIPLPHICPGALAALFLAGLVSGWGTDAWAREGRARGGIKAKQVPRIKARPKSKYHFRAYRRVANRFLKTASPQARKTFSGRQARGGLMALGAVLTRTSVDKNMLRKVLNNPHALAQKDPRLQPTIFPALRAMARLGNIKGTDDVLKRAARSVKDEGGTRGALFELVAGSAVKRMGYKLDGLSHQIGKYETDGKVNNGTKRPTLVNMKSITDRKVMWRTVGKAQDQLRKRNGTVAGRPSKDRNPALLVIAQMPGVNLGSWNWKKTARKTGADLTVIRVNPNSGKGQVLYRSGPTSR